jgi:cell wall-associated NlpC family hydrolase
MIFDKTYYCLVTQIPVRSEPKSTSEMVSQLIYGESYVVIDTYEDWLKIRSKFDHYKGWMSKANFEEGEIELKSDIQTSFIQETITPKGTFITSAGSVIPEIFISEKSTSLMQLAKSFLNVPYLWGGRTFAGIDCSGLTQILYKCFGKPLPRDAKDQQKIGKSIPFAEINYGDLVFFEKNGKVTHVGLCIEKEKIIHAHGKVRIDDLTKNGIVNDKGVLTHLFHSAKRI